MTYVATPLKPNWSDFLQGEKKQDQDSVNLKAMSAAGPTVDFRLGSWIFTSWRAIIVVGWEGEVWWVKYFSRGGAEEGQREGGEGEAGEAGAE